MFPQLYDIYNSLEERYGPQGWWPLRSRKSCGLFNSGGYHPGHLYEPDETECFEISAGAVLTQNTNWRNASGAVDALLEAGICSPAAAAEAATDTIAGLIRCSGYYNQKAVKLKNLAGFFLSEAPCSAACRTDPDASETGCFRYGGSARKPQIQLCCTPSISRISLLTPIQEGCSGVCLKAARPRPTGRMTGITVSHLISLGILSRRRNCGGNTMPSWLYTARNTAEKYRCAPAVLCLQYADGPEKVVEKKKQVYYSLLRGGP